MARAFADMNKSVLLVVDVQPKFMAAIPDAARISPRIEFICRVANLLSVPTIGTSQNPEKMGEFSPELETLLSQPSQSKMTFSCSGCQIFNDYFEATTPSQVIVVGVETHICVSQTVHDLLDLGHEVIVCADAVASRTPDRHEIGLKRISEAGAVVAHTESVAYEWLRSAGHENFRDALKIVKEY